MSLAQTFVLGWLQFAVASAAILFGATLLVRRLVQPVERIRVVQLALAATLAVPLFVAFAPWTYWRIGIPAVVAEVSSAAIEEEAPSRRTVRVVEHPVALRDRIDPSRTSQVLTSEEKLALAPPATLLPPDRVTKSSREMKSDSLEDAKPAIVAERFDGWTVAAWALLALHGLAAAGLAVETLVGSLRLRHLQRTSAAPSREVAEFWNSVSNGRGGRVRLLVSSSVETPLTFGVFRPCVLLPRDLTACGEEAVRSCLAHEWSHIENRDLATWRFAWACQFLFWMQPSFWRLRNELRLAQDMVADARSAQAGHDAVEYSALLVRFARKRGAASLGGALTFADRPSQLSRRIAMLLEPQASLRSRCSFKFSLGSLLVAIAAAAIVSGVRLDAAPASGPAGDEPSVVAPPAAGEPAASEKEPPAGFEQPAAPPAAGEAKDEVAADELAGVIVDEEGSRWRASPSTPGIGSPATRRRPTPKAGSRSRVSTRRSAPKF